MTVSAKSEHGLLNISYYVVAETQDFLLSETSKIKGINPFLVKLLIFRVDSESESKSNELK